MKMKFMSVSNVLNIIEKANEVGFLTSKLILRSLICSVVLFGTILIIGLDPNLVNYDILPYVTIDYLRETIAFVLPRFLLITAISFCFFNCLTLTRSKKTSFTSVVSSFIAVIVIYYHFSVRHIENMLEAFLPFAINTVVLLIVFKGWKNLAEALTIYNQKKGLYPRKGISLVTWKVCSVLVLILLMARVIILLLVGVGVLEFLSSYDYFMSTRGMFLDVMILVFTTFLRIISESLVTTEETKEGVLDIGTQKEEEVC